jgi:hypothetical protein
MTKRNFSSGDSGTLKTERAVALTCERVSERYKFLSPLVQAVR